VPELSRDTVGAADELAAEHDAAADARPDREHDHRVVRMLGRAAAELGPGRGVGVVLHDDREGDGGRHVVAQGLVLPRQVRGEQHGRAGRVDPGRGADADRPHGVLPG
jgi:hypothetical protein